MKRNFIALVFLLSATSGNSSPVSVNNMEVGLCLRLIESALKVDTLIDPAVGRQPSISLNFDSTDQKSVILANLQQQLIPHGLLVSDLGDANLIIISKFSNEKLWAALFGDKVKTKIKSTKPVPVKDPFESEPQKGIIRRYKR